MNMHEEEKCFNHYKSVVWNTAESPSQWILYRAAISLTQFGMQKARVAAEFRDFYIYIFLYLWFSFVLLYFGKNIVLFSVWVREHSRRRSLENDISSRRDIWADTLQLKKK